MIEVIEQINAVRRTVGDRALEAGEARIVTIGRVYDAPVEDLWDACTSAERIPRWFLPVSGDLRVGGRFQLEGNAGGLIERCDPPKSFAATWEFGGQVSRIEVRLTPEPEGGTRFELEHTVPVDEHWTRFGPGAVGIGWEMGLMGLSLHLTSGEPNDPAEWDGLGRVGGGPPLRDAERRGLERGPHRGRRARARGPRGGGPHHRRVHGRAPSGLLTGPGEVHRAVRPDRRVPLR